MLRVNMDDGGTNAGRKLPFQGGHSEKCQCSKCRPDLYGGKDAGSKTT